jgi:hypothetical protein
VPRGQMMRGKRLNAGRFAPMKLSDFELGVLRQLVNGEAVSVPPALRPRFEMVGAIREGADGIAVTAEGRRLASQRAASTSDKLPSPAAKVALDRRGRKMPLRR